MGTLYTANLIVTLLLIVACALLYLDGRGKGKALAAIQSMLAAAQQRLASQDEQIGYLASAVALLVPLDGAAVAAPGAVRVAPGPFAPEPAPVARGALPAEHAPSSMPGESPGAWVARFGAERSTLLGELAAKTPPPRDPAPSSPTLVSAGTVPSEGPPPSSAPRAIPLERAADLDAATIARVDALAEAGGMTREAVLVRCAETGLEDLERRARERDPPPSGEGPRKG